VVIGNDDDRNGAADLPHGTGGQLRTHDNNIGTEVDELARKLWQSIQLVLRIPALDPDVGAIDVAELTESLTNGRNYWIIRPGHDHEYAHDRNLIRLLCPRCSGNEDWIQREGEQDSTAIHGITSSTLTSPWTELCLGNSLTIAEGKGMSEAISRFAALLQLSDNMLARAERQDLE
jgi:hypothetical protein